MCSVIVRLCLSLCPVHYALCARYVHSASRNALDGPEGEGQMGRVDGQERCAYVVYRLKSTCTGAYV